MRGTKKIFIMLGLNNTLSFLKGRFNVQNAEQTISSLHHNLHYYNDLIQTHAALCVCYVRDRDIKEPPSSACSHLYVVVSSKGYGQNIPLFYIRSEQMKNPPLFLRGRNWSYCMTIFYVDRPYNNYGTCV